MAAGTGCAAARAVTTTSPKRGAWRSSNATASCWLPRWRSAFTLTGGVARGGRLGCVSTHRRKERHPSWRGGCSAARAAGGRLRGRGDASARIPRLQAERGNLRQRPMRPAWTQRARGRIERMLASDDRRDGRRRGDRALARAWRAPTMAQPRSAGTLAAWCPDGGRGSDAARALPAGAYQAETSAGRRPLRPRGRRGGRGGARRLPPGAGHHRRPGDRRHPRRRRSGPQSGGDHRGRELPHPRAARPWPTRPTCPARARPWS